MMKLYGFLILLVLVFNIGTGFRDESASESEEELENVLRNLGRRGFLNKQFRRRNHESPFRQEPYPEVRRRDDATKTSTPNVTLLRVTVVQRGFYLAQVKVNFIRNNKQEEVSEDYIPDGSIKKLHLQEKPTDKVTDVRIRFHADAKGDFGDLQFPEPTNANLCFVLEGSLFDPVYADCAPGENYDR